MLVFEQLIVEYAQAYLSWLQIAEERFDEQMVLSTSDQRRTDPLPLDIDVLEMRLGEEERYQSVYLLAPTHPLRLLWLVQRSRLAYVWLRQAVESGNPLELLNESVRQIIRREPAPHNLPPVLRSSRDEYSDPMTRFYVEKGILVGDWSLYLREDSDDTQMLRARVERLLGHNGRTSDTERFVAKSLARSLHRYLAQHPYVKTLQVNMFNPGDAQIIPSDLVAATGCDMQSTYLAKVTDLRRLVRRWKSYKIQNSRSARRRMPLLRPVVIRCSLS